MKFIKMDSYTIQHHLIIESFEENHHSEKSEIVIDAIES